MFLSSPYANEHALASRISGGICTVAGVGVGGPSYGLAFRARALSLGSVSVERPVALLSSDTAGAMSDGSLAGNVGAAILRRFVVTLDYPHARMFLKPIVPAPPTLDGYDQSGLRLSRSAKGTVITDVVEASPAALAGVRASDVVLTVDGRPAAERTVDEIRSLLRDQAPGTQVRLGLRRSGKAAEVTLILRPLI